MAQHVDLVELIGYSAAMLTTLAFVPQVIKTWRSKSAGDFSLGTWSAFTVGVLLWLVYGVALGAVPVIVANAITLAQSLLLVALTLRYGRSHAPSCRPRVTNAGDR